MEIQHKKAGTKGMFYVQDDDKLLAEMTYTMPSAEKMIIEHTEVDDELRGQNMGYLLVQEAVKYARNHKIKILPLCPFAHAVFKKKPEYGDVLA